MSNTIEDSNYNDYNNYNDYDDYIENGKIYKIIYRGKPCYIGRTIRSLSKRFTAHCARTAGTRLTKAIIKHGRNNFKIELIQDGIHSKRELCNLERKYILEYSKRYKLYNDVIPNEYIDEKSIRVNKNSRPIRCIETNEIFASQRVASVHYNITENSIHDACMYGYATNSLKNNQILHWQYADGTLYKEKEHIRKVYVIQQLVDDEWIPIYVGQTRYSLQERLQAHFRNKTMKIAKYLHTLPKKQIRIKCVFNNIATQAETDRLEHMLTLKLKARYKLLNLNAGQNRIKEEIKPSVKLQYKSWKEIKNSEYLQTNEICRCTKYDLIFLTYSAAAVQFNKSIVKIKQSCKEGKSITYCKDNIQFEHVPINQLDDDVKIYVEVYSIFKLIYKTIEKYIVTKLPYNEVIPTILAKKSNGISGIIDDKNAIKLEIIQTGFFFKEEAQEVYRRLTGKEKRQRHKSQPVRCITTGEIFESAFAAGEYYHKSEDTIWKNCKGLKKGFYDKATERILEWEFVNSEDKEINTNNKKYFVFVLYHHKSPIYVSISTNNDIAKILNYYRYHKKKRIYDIIVNSYEKITIKFIKQDVSELEAKRIKKETIRQLLRHGYQLVNK